VREALRIDAPRATCLQPWWVLGFAVFLMGQASAMIALGDADQEIVAYALLFASNGNRQFVTSFRCVLQNDVILRFALEYGFCAFAAR
jgi:hypothetical protein